MCGIEGKDSEKNSWLVHQETGLCWNGTANPICLVLYSGLLVLNFILPSKIIKDIESSLMAFLCSGPDMKHTGAKVKWDHICCPKLEGGLDFRKVKEWNKATMLRWAFPRRQILFGLNGYMFTLSKIRICGVCIILEMPLGPYRRFLEYGVLDNL